MSRSTNWQMLLRMTTTSDLNDQLRAEFSA
jgi:hypothetical protein